jgi:uncharacterized membrane protein YgcG
MVMSVMPRFLAALLGLVLIVGGATAAAIPVPPLTARVNDQAALLSGADAQALEDKLATFEQAKGGQIAVLIVPTTGEETIEQYSIRVVDQWKLGRKGVDDGVLVLVAKDDRKVRIEVGRGFEGVLPDAIANRIVDGFIAPKFLAGNYAGGLNDGVDRIIGVVNGGALPEPPKAASPPIAQPATVGIPIPPLTGHILSQTDVFTAAQTSQLETRLANFERGGGRKIAILLAENIGDESCDDYAHRAYKAWHLGGDGAKDDGVLIADCEQPFGHLIVVGRDLQATIPPAVAERIYSEEMALKLIGGHYVDAYEAGVDQIIDLENGKPMPLAKPDDPGDWGTAADWFAPPEFGTWTVCFVAMVFAFFIPAALLGYKSALVRGTVTLLLVGAVPLIAGSGIAFALCFALPAFFLSAKYAQETGPDPGFNWDPPASRRSSVSGWSILGSLAGMAISSAISSGGGGGSGGGGFSGGGGGFSGGGASGSW